ncbi:MAG: GNAT family N-acetyltransferase [Desertimonas sp.]
MSDSRRGVEVEVRPVGPDDVGPLGRFFTNVPEGDRTFFREDVLRPGVIEAWLGDERQHRSVAIIDDEIVGHLAVIPGVGWSRHVGELRLVVDTDHRGQGLGRLLAQRAVVEAVGLGVTKLIVDVVAEQSDTVSMFTKLGFEPEALFKDHVKDQHGETHDLLVLAHFVESLWSTMSTAGIDEVLVGGTD